MDSSLYADEKIAKIYNCQYSTVYRICFSFMKNSEDAKDMVQETFLKLISSKQQFESEKHEKAWLIVTASNTCKDELRRWKRRLEKITSLFNRKRLVRKIVLSFYGVDGMIIQTVYNLSESRKDSIVRRHFCRRGDVCEKYTCYTGRRQTERKHRAACGIFYKRRTRSRK